MRIVVVNRRSPIVGFRIPTKAERMTINNPWASTKGPSISKMKK